jgi:hypothetical protein
VLITIALKVRQLTPGEAATNHSLVLSIGAFSRWRATRSSDA